MTYYPPPRPSQRNHNGTVAALVVITLILSCCGLSVFGSILWNNTDASTSRPNPNIDNPPSTGQNPDTTVTYQVSGDGTASTISYASDLAASITQIQDITLPWEVDVIVDSTVGVATMTVQRDNTQGEVTCTILLDQTPIKTVTSSGPFAVASCSETIRP